MDCNWCRNHSVGSDLAAEYTKVSLSHTQVTMETATSWTTHLFRKFKSGLPTLSWLNTARLPWQQLIMEFSSCSGRNSWKYLRGLLCIFKWVSLCLLGKKKGMFRGHGNMYACVIVSYLSRDMQHRCSMEAVVSSTSSEVRTRQNVSP